MTYVGSGCYMGKGARGLPQLKRTKLSKKARESQIVIQKKIYEANRWWYDYKSQLNWNKLYWVYPKSNPRILHPFSVS